MASDADAVRMADDPADYFGWDGNAAHQVPRDEIDEMQRIALRERFASLREPLAVLRSAAAEQGIERLDRIEDGARLLFPHTVYKSYPISLLEKNRLDQMTKWMGRLTTSDLSKVDLSGCNGIDNWLDALEEQTGVTVVHSSGTSGAMSFLPRTRNDTRLKGAVFAMATRAFNDLEARSEIGNERWHCNFMGFRTGRSEAGRCTKWLVDHFAGDEEHLHALYEIEMSSDVMFMAGRVRRAQARGEIGQLEIPEHLKGRQAEFEAVQKNSADAVNRMFEKLLSFKGQNVYIAGMTAMLVDLAQRGLEKGHSNLYPGCMLQTGGGAKGVVLPDNWQEIVKEFTGAKKIGHYYGMSEVCMTNPKCEHGHYHIPPWVITYVLDPDTGEMLPRKGQQTGRGCFFDLVPQTYWGGFATGDEITADYDPCSCGRTTVHLHGTIERFSEKRGGDDKITCAAADDAHAAAIDFLAQTR
jgi:hypothetical protein